MSIVVDASVIVAALVDSGPHGTWAEEIVASDALYAPELVRVETMNILRRLELAKRISTHEANAAADDLRRLAIETLPFEPFAERVWALRHTVTSYDAWYVAVAEALDAPLATLDERLVAANGPACRFLTPGRK